MDGDCSTVAICRTWGQGHREIVIEGPYWEKLSDYGKEELVFHELGHCVFNRGHNEDTRDNGCPVSIMYPYIFGGSWCYSNYRDDLITELGEY